MKKQAYNPYLPSWEYVPDGEPYVFDGRVYIYGSHDRFGGGAFCENDYVCWSADVNDLGGWKYEGVIYRKDQDPLNRDGANPLYAPDVQKGLDGKYYLYCCVNGIKLTSVAVCDTPAGKYEFLGYVRYADGTNFGEREGDPFQFDPAAFVDDDGKVYFYTGFAPWDGLWERWFRSTDDIQGSCCVELERDMLTIKGEPKIIAPRAGNACGTGFEGHEFFEASSMRKINGKYYLIYSSSNSHELCYATSGRPDGGFDYGGTIVSNGDIFLDGRKPEDALNYTGNTHGSLAEINGEWYIFYHRHTNRSQFSRQACAERVVIEADGHIKQVEMTSCGLNGGALSGKGEYPSYIACNLLSAEGARFSSAESAAETHPYFTQEGGDRESGENQYIANMRDGAAAGFKYFDLRETSKVAVKLRGDGEGVFYISFGLNETPVCAIEVRAERDYKRFAGAIPSGTEKSALYFGYAGGGYVDFAAFELG
ncbi:hypothetical protein FACS1894202_03600 [Clostridia bacterium]|nr:hypothetical protein FACS1894202_03600 [Clostridia bacterium]